MSDEETSENLEDPTKEFDAIKSIHATLDELSRPAQIRVLDYIASLLGHATKSSQQEEMVRPASIGASDHRDVSPPTEFSSIAELYDAAAPNTQAEQALVAGYWLQFIENNEHFDSQSANTALKHLGHGVTNITSALSKLKSHKPALVLQIKKSGSSRQARKTYKITTAGEKFISEMVSNRAISEGSS